MDRMLPVIDAEYFKIFKKDDTGVYATCDDFDNALFPAMQAEAIAIRAVFNEVISLIEWELRAFAIKPLQQNSKLTDPFKDNISSVIKRVEHRLGDRLDTVPGWTIIERVQEKNNSFKHRKGFLVLEKKPIPSRHKVRRQEAYEAIEAARKFFLELHKRLRR